MSMKRAATALVGVHDFLAFSQQIPAGANTIRTLFSVEVKRSRKEIWIDIEGTAFLRGMMRRISGSLFEVGRGKRSEDYPASLLHWTKKEGRPPTLPACGLTLMKITYGRHPRDNRQFRASDKK